MIIFHQQYLVPHPPRPAYVSYTYGPSSNLIKKHMHALYHVKVPLSPYGHMII